MNKMPFSTSNSSSQSSSERKTNLIRSKSLRLPPTKQKGEATTAILSRHGSIRQSKNAPIVTKQLSLSSRQASKSKTNVATGNKPVDNLERMVKLFARGNGSDEGKKNASGLQWDENSEIKELSGPMGDSITLQSHKSNNSSDNSKSWTSSELAIHLKRLTEEHERLQVEYARLRIQLIENASSHPNSLSRRDMQHLSHSDSHLASIPENPSVNSRSANKEAELENKIQNQETLIQGYRGEVQRLQDENRKVQRKYWEQIMNSESVEEELGGAPQQVVDLIDKLDDKQLELNQILQRVNDLEKELIYKTTELQQSQDTLQDYQHLLEEVNHQKNNLEKKLKDTMVEFSDAKEDVEFLQAERSTMVEALQETEQSLLSTKSEAEKEKAATKELTDRCRRLSVRVQEKSLHIQLLQAELDSNEGRARDMLLSQGAELTMAALSLSQVAFSVHCILTSVAEFASSHLELETEMLEEIHSDSEESENDKLDLSQITGITPDEDGDFNELNFNEKQEQMSSDKKAESVNVNLPGSNESSQALESAEIKPSGSFVQEIIRAYEHQSKSEDSLIHKEEPKEESQDKKAAMNTSHSEGALNSISESAQAGKSLKTFKPIGMAKPFRPAYKVPEISAPLHRTGEEQIKDLEGSSVKIRSSLNQQLNQVNSLLTKLERVISVIQNKYLTSVEILKKEKAELSSKVKLSEEKIKIQDDDIHSKEDLLENANSKLKELSNSIKRVDDYHSEEKENLSKRVEDLLEEVRALKIVNDEQSRQMKEEIKSLVDASTGGTKSTYWIDAMTICDKLVLKQEIVKLKETVAYKEQLLQNLALKATKSQKCLEDNYHKAVSELHHLDKVVENALEILETIPNTSYNEKLQDVYSVLSRGSLPDKTTPTSLESDKDDIVLV